MKYLMLIYSNPSAVPDLTPEELQTASLEWQNLATEATAAGVLLSSHGLASVTDATTIRVREGKTLITDGPFAETHEQLGGYFLFDCQDMDEAIRWAAKLPGAKYGSIEVRPVMIYPQE